MIPFIVFLIFILSLDKELVFLLYYIKLNHSFFWLTVLFFDNKLLIKQIRKLINFYGKLLSNLKLLF